MGSVDAREDAAMPECEAAEQESLPAASNCINEACNRLIFAAVTFCPYCAQKQERDAPSLEYPQPPQPARFESLAADFTAALPPVPQDPSTEVRDEQLAPRTPLPQPPPRETLTDALMAPALVLQPAAEAVLRVEPLQRGAPQSQVDAEEPTQSAPEPRVLEDAARDVVAQAAKRAQSWPETRPPIDLKLEAAPEAIIRVEPLRQATPEAGSPERAPVDIAADRSLAIEPLAEAAPEPISPNEAFEPPAKIDPVILAPPESMSPKETPPEAAHESLAEVERAIEAAPERLSPKEIPPAPPGIEDARASVSRAGAPPEDAPEAIVQSAPVKPAPEPDLTLHEIDDEVTVRLEPVIEAAPQNLFPQETPPEPAGIEDARASVSRAEVPPEDAPEAVVQSAFVKPAPQPGLRITPLHEIDDEVTVRLEPLIEGAPQPVARSEQREAVTEEFGISTFGEAPAEAAAPRPQPRQMDSAAPAPEVTAREPATIAQPMRLVSAPTPARAETLRVKSAIRARWIPAVTVLVAVAVAGGAAWNFLKRTAVPELPAPAQATMQPQPVTAEPTPAGGPAASLPPVPSASQEKAAPEPTMDASKSASPTPPTNDEAKLPPSPPATGAVDEAKTTASPPAAGPIAEPKTPAPPQLAKLEILQPKSSVLAGQQLRVIANMEIAGGEPNAATAIETEYGLYTADGREVGKPVRARALGGQGSRAISMPIRAPTNAGSYVLRVAVYLDGTKAKEATAMLDVAPAPAVQPSLQPQQAAPDPKLIECRTLVRAGRQALTDRNYDTAIANGAEAISVAPQCPGAQQLSIDARKAKQEAQASTIIQ